MVTVLLDLLAGLGFGALLVAVHEHGHLVAGRLLGVPRDSIRVELTSSPPHVALREDDRWLSPDDPGYPDAFSRHSPGSVRAWVFVAGGTTVETLLALLSVVILAVLGAEPVALVLAAATLVLFVIYLGLDLALSLRARAPYGDVAVAWTLSPVVTGAWVLVIGGLKAASLAWLL